MDERVETASAPARVERDTTIIRTGGGRGGNNVLVAIVGVAVLALLAFMLLGGGMKRVFGGGDINIDVKAPKIELPSTDAPSKPADGK
jgi:predicted metalloprotease